MLNTVCTYWELLQLNYKKLIKNIEDNVNKFNAVEKEDKGYGKRYEASF